MKHYTHYQPKIKGKSDFYSWDLFRWLRQQHRTRMGRVFIFETPREATPYVIGYRDLEGCIIGFRLKELCSTGSDKQFPQVFCYGNQAWEDVTDWFWSEYERIGVCAIHGDWAHDFTYLSDNTARMCQHCGKIEKRKVEMVERVTWEGIR